MSIWARLKNFLSSNIDTVLSRAENPEKMIALLLEEIREQHRIGRQHTAAALAEEKRSTRRREEELKCAADLEEEVLAALEEGHVDRARDVAERKLQHERRAERYEALCQTQTALATSLKSVLEGLVQRIDQAQRDRSLLLAEKRDGDARTGQAEVLEAIQDSEPADTLDKFLERARASLPAHDPNREQELREMDGVAEAMYRASNLKSEGDDLLSESSAVDDELSRLKAILDAPPDEDSNT